MSLLLRLLTTGKSLVGVKDESHRYRATNLRLLPSFGTGKNPFLTQPEGGGGESVGQSGAVQPPTRPAQKAESRRPWFSSVSKASAKPSPVRAVAPVQGELALDKVQVVRNDLSDVDLEVVPLRSAVKVTPVPPVPNVRGAAGEATGWGKPANRLLGLLKT